MRLPAATYESVTYQTLPSGNQTQPKKGSKYGNNSNMSTATGTSALKPKNV